ncbi:MAG: T9SS type A sorting domain-containing protein [Chitinophagales bacterium]|nr:T9SS type A sorting domain-containing protein [Chitinophagales bacterium]
MVFFWTDSNETHGQFSQLYLAPDGKIYAANYQGFTKALHVINSPDSADSACGFVKWGLSIPSNDARIIPNMLHFRMGALTGSGCDTLNTDIGHQTQDERRIQVYPNPANDVVQVDLMNYSQYHPLQQFYLYNAQGQLVKQVALPYLSAAFRVSDLPSGVYYWQLAVGAEVRGAGKLEVVR